jgi:hypothetical protein
MVLPELVSVDFVDKLLITYQHNNFVDFVDKMLINLSTQSKALTATVSAI